jgi:hypothetical protein
MRDRDSDPPPLSRNVSVEGRDPEHDLRNLLQVLIGQVGIARRLANRGESVTEILVELEETVHALSAATTRRHGA